MVKNAYRIQVPSEVTWDGNVYSYMREVKRGENAPKMGKLRMLAIVFVPDRPKFK